MCLIVNKSKRIPKDRSIRYKVLRVGNTNLETNLFSPFCSLEWKIGEPKFEEKKRSVNASGFHVFRYKKDAMSLIEIMKRIYGYEYKVFECECSNFVARGKGNIAFGFEPLCEVWQQVTITKEI